MATRVGRGAAPAAPADPAVQELAILHPERSVVVGARTLTVREYGFIEGLQLRATAKPFLDALYRLAAEHGGAPSFGQVEEMLGDHQECVLALIAQAADVEVAFLQSLSDEDGYLLMQTWWMVNARFFIRRILARLAALRVAARPAGSASTPPSSAPATEGTPPTSADSPPAS